MTACRTRSTVVFERIFRSCGCQLDAVLREAELEAPVAYAAAARPWLGLRRPQAAAAAQGHREPRWWWIKWMRCLHRRAVATARFVMRLGAGRLAGNAAPEIDAAIRSRSKELVQVTEEPKFDRIELEVVIRFWVRSGSRCWWSRTPTRWRGSGTGSRRGMKSTQ
jgi:hypothetical protein